MIALPEGVAVLLSSLLVLLVVVLEVPAVLEALDGSLEAHPVNMASIIADIIKKLTSFFIFITPFCLLFSSLCSYPRIGPFCQNQSQFFVKSV